jgi:PAS domain S-box-containing protein
METGAIRAERPGFGPARRRLAALLATVLLLLALAFAALTRADHEASLADGWASVERAAFGAAEHAERTLAVARLVTDHVADRVRREGIAAFTGPGQSDLVALLEHAPQIGSLWLLDQAGRLESYTLAPVAPSLDLSNRPYFAPLRDGAEEELSPMLLGRVTRLWFFGYNLAIRDRNGDFLGLVQASLHAEEFQRFQAGLGLGPAGRVGLYRLADGAPVMLYPLPPADEAERPPAGPAAPAAELRRVAEAEQEGRYTVPTSDGGELLVAWRVVGQGRGVIAVAARPRADALGAFHARLWRNALFFALAMLLVTGLGAGVAAALARAARSRRAVEAGQRELATLLEASNEGVIALDPGWRITFLNRRGARLLADPRAEIGADFRLALPELASGAAGAAIARTMALRQPAAAEQPWSSPDRALRFEAHPREDGGLVAYFRDVTEERAAQHRLAESESRLRQLFQAIDEGYALCELVLDEAGRPTDFRYIEVNPLFTPMTGLIDPVGRTALELRPAGIEEHWLDLYGRVALGGETLRFERGSASLGRWFDIFATPVAPRGRFALVVRDITARRAAEAALRESEERLRRAQQAGGVGVWELDLVSGRVFWSDALRAILGLPSGATADRDLFLGLIHPEDRARVRENSARAQAEPAARYDVEFRIRRADTGEERWLVGLGEVERDAAGLPLRMVGVNMDVTERRRAAAALAESEARLRLAQEAAEAGVFERVLPGARAWWSAGMFRLYGLDPTGRSPWVEEAEHLSLLEPEDREAHRLRREAVRNDPTYTRFDYAFRIRRADTGEQRWIAARGEVVRDAEGRPLLVRGINQDITERRRSEERQMLLAREVDHRAKNALAVVQAIVGLTRDTDPEAFRAAVVGRIAAMARAHNLLAREGWDQAELGELIEAELAPLRAGAAEATDRIHMAGPPIALAAGAAQPLAMALHELATNAAKYGALSQPGGTVAVTWRRCEEGGLDLRWTERGGPPLVGPPGHAGFGSSVVRNTVERQLGGTTRFDWQAEGLEVTLQLPARQLRRVVAG